MGVNYPMEVLQTEFNLELFYFSKALKNENYLKQGLRNDGLTEKQISEMIHNGRYVKEFPKKKDEKGKV